MAINNPGLIRRHQNTQWEGLRVNGNGAYWWAKENGAKKIVTLLGINSPSVGRK